MPTNKRRSSYTRLQFLDQCTNGDIHKFQSLISEDYDHMSVAFSKIDSILRTSKVPDNALEIIDITNGDNEVQYNIHIRPEYYDQVEQTLSTKQPEGVTLENETKSICIHISVR